MKLVSGIDLVEINRIISLKPAIKTRFLCRILTPKERETHITDKSIAGVFAAKEAAAKALGCGIGPISWQDLVVLPDEQGKPALFLKGYALEVANTTGISLWSVSITHTETLAAATVIGIGLGNETSHPE
jgi:holo-[acyl-carrier protein] synthase